MNAVLQVITVVLVIAAGSAFAQAGAGDQNSGRNQNARGPSANSLTLSGTLDKGGTSSSKSGSTKQVPSGATSLSKDPAGLGSKQKASSR